MTVSCHLTHVAALCRSSYYQLRQLHPVARSLSTEARTLCVQPTGLLQVCNAPLHGVSEGLLCRLQPSRTRNLSLLRGAAITSRRFCDNSTGCPCDNESNSRLLSWSSSVYPAIHRRIWQTTVSSSLTSARADSARPTQRCVLFDVHTTPSAIGVSQRLGPRL